MKILRPKYRKSPKKTGFTIIEVIVATLIFSLAMAGIFATTYELRSPAVESTQEVTAAFIGKKILDDLRKEVNAQSWNSTGNLLPGTYTLTPITVGTKTYNVTYNVYDDPNGTSARRVDLNVTW